MEKKESSYSDGEKNWPAKNLKFDFRFTTSTAY